MNQHSHYLAYGSVSCSIEVEDPSNFITFGCGENILMFDSYLQYQHQKSFDDGVRSVALCSKRNEVYYLKTNRVVECMSADCLVLKHQLKKFSSTNNYPRIAVNDRYVAVSNAERYKLHLYGFSSKTWQPYFAGIDKEWLRSLKFHPDGDLLTLNNDGWIRKYRISDTEAPEVKWESRATANKSYALCVDQNTGLVYVTGSNHMLYILSAGMSVNMQYLCENPICYEVQPRPGEVTQILVTKKLL